MWSHKGTVHHESIGPLRFVPLHHCDGTQNHNVQSSKAPIKLDWREKNNYFVRGSGFKSIAISLQRVFFPHPIVKITVKFLNFTN